MYELRYDLISKRSWEENTNGGCILFSVFRSLAGRLGLEYVIILILYVYQLERFTSPYFSSCKLISNPIYKVYWFSFFHVVSRPKTKSCNKCQHSPPHLLSTCIVIPEPTPPVYKGKLHTTFRSFASCLLTAQVVSTNISLPRFPIPSKYQFSQSSLIRVIFNHIILVLEENCLLQASFALAANP